MKRRYISCSSEDKNPHQGNRSLRFKAVLTISILVIAGVLCNRIFLKIPTETFNTGVSLKFETGIAYGKSGAAHSPAEKPILSPSEREYLKSLGPVSVCPDPDWIPYSYVDGSGNFRGICADLMELISVRLGIEFRYILPKDWDEALKRSKNGEVLVLPFLNRSDERDGWLIFTEPLFVDPNVFITRTEHPYISDPSTLAGQRIVFPDGTSVEERVRKDYPNLIVLNVPDESGVFRAISELRADMTLRSLTVAAYTIRKEGLFNLKVAGQAPDRYTNRLRLGVLKNEPMLRDILDKAIASITQSERDEIANRHVNITVVRSMDYRFIMQVAGVLGVLIALSFYWNYRLKKINERLFESERSKSVLISNLPGIAYRCRYDRNWTMEFVSEGCLALTGYNSDDLLESKRLSYNDIVVPEERERLWERWEEARVAGSGRVQIEYRIRTADGKIKWVFEQGVFVYGEDGSIKAIEGLVIDISDRKSAEQRLENAVTELRSSLAEIKTLRGIVPMCANCKKIRDDAGFWNQVEAYLSRHTEASFSHGICPDCMKKLYPDFCH